MTRICHYWPGLTPFNVWRLPVDEWVMFALACDEQTRAERETR